MSAPARLVYVISDLHLGGVYPEAGAPNDRGFRICTHVPELAAFVDALARRPAGAPAIELVINGDIVDFLAESDNGEGRWSAFTAHADSAVAKLEAIMGRDRAFADALGRFLERGHRLVLTLGNHDIELSLPAVRRRLHALLGITGRHDFEFLFDGEAYLVGDVLIEHGNRYDPWNVVDYDGLRRVRSLQSRRQPVPRQYDFAPPAGSFMVATVVNPIKQAYKFIDLLKPENSVMAPLLLALEPGCRSGLARVAKLALSTMRHRLESAALPGHGGDISASDGMGGGGSDISAADADPDAALQAVLGDALGGDGAGFLNALDGGAAAPATGSDISAGGVLDLASGLFGLLTGDRREHAQSRLPTLLKAMRALQGPDVHDRAVEHAREYVDAAQTLARDGIRHVVFGHTHYPKQIPLAGGGYYFNAGSWADMMRFPGEALAGDEITALERLGEFLHDVGQGDYRRWIQFEPTYVRLAFDATGAAVDAELCDWTSGRDP